MHTKYCTKCKKYVSLKNFFKRNSKKGGKRRVQAWCKKCMHEDHLIRYRQNFRKVSMRTKMRRQEFMQRIFEYFEKHPCADCGETNPIVLEFDHKDPSKKINTVSALITKTSWKNIYNEILKCDVVCANCHRVRTVKQFKHYQWYVV